MNQDNSKFMPLPTLLYIVGWGYFVYLYVLIFNFTSKGSGDFIVTGLFYLDLIIHEGCHFITMMFPQIINAAAGSIGAMIVAILAIISTIYNKSYFAAVFAGLWTMLSMISASIYMADARTQALPLLGGGTNHDWAYVFGQLGWLRQDLFIAGLVRGTGVTIGTIAIIYGLFLIVIKIKNNYKIKTI